MKSTEQFNVREVPPSLYAAVERDAQENDRNRNDVICEILATRFKVAFEPSGYPFRPSDGSDQWMLRMSSALLEALRAAAREGSAPGRQIAVSRLIFATLQAHYGLPVESPRRRSAWPPLDPQMVSEARARHEAGESIRSLARRYKVKRETLTRAIRAA